MKNCAAALILVAFIALASKDGCLGPTIGCVQGRGRPLLAELSAIWKPSTSGLSDICYRKGEKIWR